MADGGKVIIKIDGDNNGFKNAMGGIGKIAGTAFKGIAIGATSAATAIGDIGTAAVISYAEFEQLSGGAQKIFDEIDYAKIKKDADEAFKTMQISANQYLQLMTTVGANFASTLGDAKGYEVAKQGMKAITDFATGTGRSIDELSEKYQMITKSTSSYQSIADQFAGVLPATSAEFLKQAQAAGILSESYTKLTEVPMAEYQEAVTQMIAKGVDALGLTNNAANEAATTLSGSFNMLKASWDNLMVGLADPSQDLDVLIDNVINSATALLENVGPIIENVLDSLPIAINTLGTKLIQALPGLVNVLLPELANTASQLIDTLTQALTSNAESLGTTALTVFMTLINCFLENLPLLLDTALTLIITLAEGLTQALPQLIPSTVSVVLKIVDTLLDNIDMLVDVAIELILALTDGIILALPILMEKAPEIIIKFVSAIIKNLPKILSAGKEVPAKLWEGIKNGISTYLSDWGNIIHEKIIQPIKDKATEMISVGKDLLDGLWNGISKNIEGLKKKISGVVESIKSVFTTGLKIHSPSKWSEQVFAYVIDGGVNGLEKRKGKLIDKAAEIVKATKTELEKINTSSILNLSGKAFDYVIGGTLNDVEKRKNNLINGIADIIKDRRTEVQKVKDSFIDNRLESEKLYESESLRIKEEREKEEEEEEKRIAQYNKKIERLENEKTKSDKAIKEKEKRIQERYEEDSARLQEKAEALRKKDEEEAERYNKIIEGLNNEKLETDKEFKEKESKQQQEFEAQSEERRREKEEKEYKQKLKDAKTEEERQKIKNERTKKLEEEALEKSFELEKENAEESLKLEKETAEEKYKVKVENAKNEEERRKKEREQELKEIEETESEKLESEKKYAEESLRLEKERLDEEYDIKIKNAQNEEEQRKLIREKALKEKEIADNEYLQNLKDIAEKERKIYDAMQKDIENSKKQIIDNFTEMTESAFNSIKELENTQKTFADKLKSYGSLYRTYELPTITLKNGEQITPERTELADLGKQNQVLKDYADALQAVKKKGNVPKEFFTILRDMSVEEGTKFANTLLNASQEDFDAYIKDWETNQKLAEELSKEMYADEAESLTKEITSKFDMAASEFFEAGENSAEQFGEGFIEELKNMFANVRTELNAYFGSITPSVAIAGMGNGTAFSSSNSYSPTYNIYGPYDQSTRQQIKAEDTKIKLQWLRGGYKS